MSQGHPRRGVAESWGHYVPPVVQRPGTYQPTIFRHAFNSVRV